MHFFSDEVRIYDINIEWGKYFTKAETKANWQKFLNDFEIKSINMVGYPDYLEYEMDNGREVLSWWKFTVVRKADKKEITLPIHISSGFDEKGKIISQIIYYSLSLISQK